MTEPERINKARDLCNSLVELLGLPACNQIHAQKIVLSYLTEAENRGRQQALPPLECDKDLRDELAAILYTDAPADNFEEEIDSILALCARVRQAQKEENRDALNLLQWVVDTVPYSFWHENKYRGEVYQKIAAAIRTGRE